MDILISTRKNQMINEQKANWKNLNWAKGLDRIYYIAWAVVFLITVGEYNTSRHFESLVTVAITGITVPFLIRKLIYWVVQGFKK